ncbi:MAG: hypothetical protein KG075_16210 [Alphaproteobacteria bacterium]|nr:hypothetical protein [Alphaproteobacteria bacterium]
MTKAERYYQLKEVLDDGTIIEMSVWVVPAPVAGSDHSFKYRLYCGRDGERLVGYDNERGKGDHKHILGKETSYRFKTVEKLVSDFLADVRKYGGVKS